MINVNLLIPSILKPIILTQNEIYVLKIQNLVNMLKYLLNCYSTSPYLEQKLNVLIFRTPINISMKSNGHRVAKVDDVLNHWGFVSNPYYDHELLADILFELFVNREASIEEFYKSLRLNTSIFCIEGDYGSESPPFSGAAPWGRNNWMNQIS